MLPVVRKVILRITLLIATHDSLSTGSVEDFFLKWLYRGYIDRERGKEHGSFYIVYWGYRGIEEKKKDTVFVVLGG